MKRSHPSDGVSTSHSEGTSYPGDSHVGVISIADSHLPSTSMNCLSKLPILWRNSLTLLHLICLYSLDSPLAAKSSRNVARRGRAWNGNRSSNFSSRPACNFENLRFKVSEDSQKIIVTLTRAMLFLQYVKISWFRFWHFQVYCNAEGPSYTLPVDQPPIISLQKRKTNSNWKIFLRQVLQFHSLSRKQKNMCLSLIKMIPDCQRLCPNDFFF